VVDERSSVVSAVQASRRRDARAAVHGVADSFDRRVGDDSVGRVVALHGGRLHRRREPPAPRRADEVAPRVLGGGLSLVAVGSDLDRVGGLCIYPCGEVDLVE